jgi:small subunit ribosomal protein S13
MARIAGVDLQDNWRLGYALTRIKGIGWAISRDITKALKLDGTKRIKTLVPDEISKLASKIEEFPTEGELIKRVRVNVQRLKATGSYRGTRHAKNLPARGQRTRRNARTKRGKRKTVGAFKKEAMSKTAQANAQK